MEPMTLRQHRMSRGLTIRALAQQAEMSTQTIVAIEHGKPARMGTFEKLAKAFSVPMMEIREYRNMVMGGERSQ